MIAVSIHRDTEDASAPRFRAIAGAYQSIGRTAGEALDSLLEQEGRLVESSTITIQRFAPDAFFTQAQFDRMKELLGRANSLTIEENAELDGLIDAELDATVARAEQSRHRTGR